MKGDGSMAIHMHISWYERFPDMTPNYDREHHGTIEGETPDECMRKFNAYRDRHNLAENTPMQILYIY